MTNKEAIKLLDPSTTVEALAEIEYYNGFSGREACIKAIEDACVLAVEALEKQMPKKPIKSDKEIRYCEVWECPSCGFEWSSRVVNYCYKCGQRIDWSDEDGK